MILKTTSLEHLARAFYDVYCALNEVIQDLQYSPPARNYTKQTKRPNENCAGEIISQNNFTVHYEDHQLRQYNLLDQQYAELQAQEWELKRAYHSSSNNVEQHDRLLAELDAVRQEMTEIENWNNYSNGDG
jgi:hypothetical protein